MPLGRDPTARPVFGGREVTTSFSGTWRDGHSEVFGTSLVGARSISFRATLRGAGRLNGGVPARAAVNRSQSRRAR